MKTTIFLLSFLLPLFAFTSPQNESLTECPAPANVNIASQAETTITFDWDDCGCSPQEYRVYYVKNGQASSEYSTGSSGITITGLTGGNYDFYFYTVCGAEASSQIIIQDVPVI